MQQEFKMYDNGEIYYIIGNAIIRNRQKGWLILHQQKYLTSNLQEFNKLNYNTSSTPMQCGVCLSKEDSPTTKEIHKITSQYPYSYIFYKPNACVVKFKTRLCLLCEQFSTISYRSRTNAYLNSKEDIVLH